MTDEEVKKGLECCATMPCGECENCPYSLGNCKQDLLEDALALINRLEEENKTLSDKNKELRELCRKKSNEMNIKDWVRMTQEANWGIKLVDKQEEINRISKETAKEILQEIACYRAVSPAFSKTWYALAEKYGVEIEK